MASSSDPLDIPANITNITASALSAIPDGINGYIATKDLIIAICICAGIILIVGVLFLLYRRRAHKKIAKAGNVQISVSRGGK